MSMFFASAADKLKFLRKFVTGYEASDGWRIQSGRILYPNHLTTNKARKALEQLNDDLDAILAATATPYKISRIRKSEKRTLINYLSGVLVKPSKMKVAIVRAESKQSKIKKVYKNGYQVSEGIFQKYYFMFDIIKLDMYGLDYLRSIVETVIPKHLKQRFKMLSSFGNVEFNGAFQSLKALAAEILMLAGKYRDDVRRGAFMRAFVCYAYHPEFVDEQALKLHMEDMGEARNYKQKKRRVLKERNIEL